jgi:hypothetical protein
MESNSRHTINLKQYRRLDGKWQFVPVVKENERPNPKPVLVSGIPWHTGQLAPPEGIEAD